MSSQGTHLLAPKDWQDFERSTRILMKCVLDDPRARLNGRAGQAQAGVDVWGTRRSDKALVGVQCKKSRDEIDEKELRAEVAKARTFAPPLNEFILATTALRDAKIQKVARLITTELRKTGAALEVYVWGWEDIEEEASQHFEAVNAFDPTWNPFAARLQADLAAMHSDLAARHAALAEQIEALLADMAASPAAPRHSLRDARLLETFERRVTPGILAYLRDHDFRNPVMSSQIEPFEEMDEAWRGASFEFADGEVQDAFAPVMAAMNQFAGLTLDRLFHTERECVRTSRSDEDLRTRVRAQSTRDGEKAMNEAAAGLWRAIDDFLRVAHARIAI